MKIKDAKGQEFKTYTVAKDDYPELEGKIINYVHSSRERHSELLMECKNIAGIEELKNFDLFAAAGGALYGLNDAYGEATLLDEAIDDTVDINDNCYPCNGDRLRLSG